MKFFIFAAIAILATCTQASAQTANSINLDVVCVDSNGNRTVGKATVDSSTSEGTMTFQYMFQGSPAVTVPVIYKDGSVAQGLESKDGSIIMGNGTGDAENLNRLTVQEMIGGSLVTKTNIKPGYCSINVD